MNCCEELVTVIMSVYKTDQLLLKRAVESILAQTHTNIEFIIVDDGADEECRHYINSLNDDRIIIIENGRNIGLAASLNKGIDLAKGIYIARMDADDYSLPVRICEQAKYMREHPDVDVLACISLDIQNGKLTGGIGGAYRKFDSETISIELSIGPKSFPHPGVMFRTQFLKDNAIRYDDRYIRAQDYNMWARCSVKGRLDSLQKVLLLYNIEEGRNNDISELQRYYSDLTKEMCLRRLLPDPSDDEKNLYVNMKNTAMTGTVKENLELVRKLIDANNKRKVYDRTKYARTLYFWWGRKMLYSENRCYLTDFSKAPGFLREVLAAYIVKFPDHICQKLYEKHIVHSKIGEIRL